MGLPVGVGDLVGDQLVDGVRVGHPQQRLGQAHEDHALAARQLELVQEGVEPAVSVALPADLGDQGAGAGGDTVEHVVRQLGLIGQAAHHLGFVGAVVVAKGSAQGVRRGRR